MKIKQKLKNSLFTFQQNSNINVKSSSKNTANKKKQHDHPKRVNFPYKKHDKILLVGEGNFSFGAALVSLFTPEYTTDEIEVMKQAGISTSEYMKPEIEICATCFDSLDIIHEKYPDAVQHLKVLESNGMSVLYGVDACKLDPKMFFGSQSNGKRARPFDKIVFNFPHVGMGIKDKDRNVKANQELILGFLRSASSLLLSSTSNNHPSTTYNSASNSLGEIHLTIKGGVPYDEWNIKGLAKISGLVCKTSFEFDPLVYPGYAHRRTLGFKEGLSKPDNEELKDCRTFIFSPFNTDTNLENILLLNKTKSKNSKSRNANDKNKRMKRKRRDSDSD